MAKRTYLFKDEGKLIDSNYIPGRVPHRNKELSLLNQVFLLLLKDTQKLSFRILVVGNSGVGKTAAIKIFGNMSLKEALKRNFSIDSIYVNCKKRDTSYKVTVKSTRSFEKDFPAKEYTPHNLLDFINSYLNNKKNTHLLVILDEVDDLFDKNDDGVIDSLTTLSFNPPRRVSLIGILKDLSCLKKLDVSTSSLLKQNIIRFENYAKDEIFDILRYRAEIGLQENVLPDDSIEKMADLILNTSDIRYGLNLIWEAGKIAESKNLEFITSECIKLSNQNLNNSQ